MTIRKKTIENQYKDFAVCAVIAVGDRCIYYRDF